MTASRPRYPTDLTDAQWPSSPTDPRTQAGRPLGFPPAPRTAGRNALPDTGGLRLATAAHDLPPWQTVYHYL